MRTLGERQFEFPETSEEAKLWSDSQVTEYRALHRKVLCHAHTRIEGAWCAYIFPVKGKSHQEEWRGWREDGVKLPEEIAKLLFPAFEGIALSLIHI